MNFIESVKMAGQTLLANKIRSSLTAIGMIVGNASVIAMIGIGEGAQKYVGEQVQALGTNVLIVRPGLPNARRNTITNAPQTLVLEDARAIATQVPSVQGVSAELNSSEIVRSDNKNVSALIFGTIPEFLEVRSFDMAKGRFLTEIDLKQNSQVAVLGSELAEKLFGNTNPIGQQVRIKNASMKVIGVLAPKGTSFGTNFDNSAAVPISTMANRVVGRKSPYGLAVTSIFVSIENESQMDAAQFQVENLLRLRHKITGEDDFTVRNQKDLMARMGAISGALTIMLTAVASISLLVGGIGIMNIMLVSVSERTQEIGLRKAIGASQQDILLQFIIEAVILSAAGGIVGTCVGVGGVLLVGNFTPLQAGISPVAIALAVSVSGGVGLCFGVIPARQAAKLDPIAALRSA
ncbi:MAG: FtsX-like permease family protein [Richelia sp. CSU_2_1]|nr:FtsX-like permease family protein [Microcoleus sp. SU_5_6]NJL69255.1 FtsX-like permease family protein [Microcoleus sp. SM1_3_4]NJR24414.1 FtsX-like permease family protein [Richelia sp. CSU_2_1]